MYIHTHGLEVKASACNAGNPSSIPGSGRSPGEGNGNPFQYSCLGKSHGQRRLMAYSLWGRRVRNNWACMQLNKQKDIFKN